MLGKEVNSPEIEDKEAANQFDNMQEIANAPFGAHMNLSKEEYAKKMAALEAQQSIHDEQREPLKMENTGSAGVVRRKMVFHDFDYINPFTNLPEGQVSTKPNLMNKSISKSSRHLDPFGSYQGSHGKGRKKFNIDSPSKSVYFGSDSGKKKRSPKRNVKTLSPIRHQNQRLNGVR